MSSRPVQYRNRSSVNCDPALGAPAFRTLLLVLYGAGLRRGEALHLTLADVDLQAAVLTVREGCTTRKWGFAVEVLSER